MKIALAGAEVRNNDMAFNLAQMQACMVQAREQAAELVCFGEAFLQGFDAFCWKYEKDRAIAVSVEDDLFQHLLRETAEQGIDLLFGFLEQDGDALYSSCALLGGGKLIRLYRRVSVGWKEYTRTDGHYREGDAPAVFDYRGRQCLIALCGDLWDVTAPLFHRGQQITFWPVYIDFTKEEWYGEENERLQYAQKAGEFGGDVLMINSVGEGALGGCYHFAKGEIKAEWPLGAEGMLITEI